MQVGKLSAYNMNKNFSGFYSQMNGTSGSGFMNYCQKVLHNQEQIVRCQLRDGSTSPAGYIKYWNMDGTEAAQFTIGSGGVSYKNILDITWLNDEKKYAYITMDPALVPASSYNVYKCGSDGANPELVISGFDGGDQYAAWAVASVSGYIGIASSDSDLFLKAGKNLYKVPEGNTGSWVSMSSSIPYTSDAFHYGDGALCRNMMFQPTTSGTTSGNLLYTWYDSGIDTLYLRSIDTDTLSYSTDRWAMLGISDYGSVGERPFLNQLDYNSLHYLSITAYTSSTVSGARATNTLAYLQTFNIDEDLAAFLNVNSSDVVMPAGIGAQADITAVVVNCWGTTLSGKLVQFWVSSGDGSVYPTYAYTTSDGQAQTVFSTGSNVGTSSVSVVVNEV